MHHQVEVDVLSGYQTMDRLRDPDYRAYAWNCMLAAVGTYPDVTASGVRSAAAQKREADRDPLRDRPFRHFNI